MPTIEEQLKLEKKMVSFGITRYRAGEASAHDKMRGSETQAAQRLMQEFVHPVAQAVKDFTDDVRPGVRSKFRAHMRLLDPYVVAYIGLRAVFDHFTHEKSIVHLGRHIGMLLEDEVKFTRFQSEHKEYYDTIIEDFKKKGTSSYRHMHRVLTLKANEKDISWEDWSPSERLNIGIKLVDLIMQSTDLIEKGVNKAKGKYKGTPCIVPSAAAQDWINGYNAYAELLHPDRGPCIIPPDPWTGLEQGGYYSPQLRKRTKLVKFRDKNQRDNFSGDVPAVLSAVNALQNTAWCVNSKVFSVLKQVWDNSLEIGLPRAEPYEIPESPVAGISKDKMTEEQRAALEEWKAEARVVHTMNKERVSKCFQVMRVMRMASEYMQYDKFWYVYQCDFRGRIYATSTGLSPQGPDFSKGCLQFAEGKPLGADGAYWLQVHGANTYGEDKLAYNDRVKWVKDNHAAIMACADDPLTHRSFWGNADKPWQFLAFCFEYARLQTEGESMLSYLPIGLDGSCNGLQNFSAMLRDPVGGAATNLLPADKPNDIYREVADACTRILREKPVEELSTAWLRFVSENGGMLPRGLAKRPVMTLPYGSTQQSCREYIYKYMVEEAPDSFPKELRFRLATYLTPIMWEAIGQVVVAARHAMSWIQQAVGLLAKENIPAQWRTPVGFTVYQDNKRQEIRRVETQLAGRLRLRMAEPTEDIDPYKQRLGASPNFVHSMDACHLMLTLNRASSAGITSFACIHDDYGTHAADTGALHKAIRESFREMYTNHNPLRDLKESLEKSYGKALPDLPESGNLNLDSVMESLYFFG